MRCVALILAGCLLSSCATISRGRYEVIVVDSDPPGANATVKCRGRVSDSGTTPARMTIPREADGCRVHVEKSGMQPQTITLDRGFNASYWMNFIPIGGFPLAVIAAFRNGGSNSVALGALGLGIFGAAGLIVDRLNGAMYDHNPNVIKVTLQPER